MVMERCTCWVCWLQPKVPEALTWMRCWGGRCSGGTQSRSQNSAQSEIVATIVQNTGDIEAGGVEISAPKKKKIPFSELVATVVQNTGDIEAGGVEIGAPKKNKFPFSELVSLFQVAVVATIGALGMVPWTRLSCEKWWVPTLLFSTVAVAVAALASSIVNKHLISNFKVVLFIGSLVFYLGCTIGMILFISIQMLCHG